MTRSLVIVPAFDEAATLPGTLAELASTCPDLDVVVVDDGSSDGTAAAAAAAGAIVLRLPYNLGVGSAVRTALHYAVDEGYERAVRIDADGQHDPADVARLLAALAFLFLVVVHLTRELSRLETRSRAVAEELALLRRRVDELEGDGGP